MTDSDAELVDERRGAIQILRINRPEARNALNGAVLAGLGRALTEADDDPSVRVVIITATGDRAFCAGMDLRGFAERREGSGSGADEQQMRDSAGYVRWQREGIATPVICAANATAIAGGFELLLACDLVVASSEAKFGLPEVKRGLFPAGGGYQLSRRIPLALAMELTLTGDMIDAQRAADIGLVNVVCPPDRVLDEAIALAERITANGPLGVAAAKQLMRKAYTDGFEAAAALQNELHPKVFGSDDAREGATAFLERRPPVWTGR